MPAPQKGFFASLLEFRLASGHPAPCDAQARPTMLLTKPCTTYLAQQGHGALNFAFTVQRFAAFGVIKPDEDGVPKVKLYRDKATGAAKGDGLVTFLYEPSVSLSV